ncbi:S8 family serine peptidase [Terrihabitans rhizophilus]|uniref:S8 family serine peptidase n=1 Tax=Terrihabitans rhizophilus TaxID=3092662 RepID=A0ABU4RL53_9HYPH|nr:S8 family serine peptidase [Terrihabitans sp. PJ23]MDX6804819.1 S8 family serine peptidase [Terrihabitans sp. PJ23]
MKPPRATARKATVPTNAAPREMAAAEYRPDEILVETSREMPGAEMDGLAQRNRLEQLGAQDIALLDARLHRLRITDGRAPAQVAASLRNSPGVRSAEPNRVFALQQTETGDAQGYAAEKLMLPAVHELSKGTSVLIALIDSGADASHPELAGVIAEQFDAVGGTFTPHAHGTGMAGAIAAHAQLTGAAPQARILNVRAFAPSGSSNAGTTYDILRGLDWAAERRARIFNLSFAGPRDPLISRAIREVSRRGGVIVAAAGNAGPASPPLYPAAEVGVIAATATDLHDKALGLANRGSYVTVAAPGVDILLPTAGGGYTISSGTSIATAYVSGIAALLIARHPETKADEIYAVLAATARDLGIAGRDKEFGAGLVQPLAALQAMEREIASTPALVDER